MSENKSKPGEDRVPAGQRFLDDIFLLLALGLGIPLLLYIVWSVIDLVRVPVFQP
ncbi:MAG: hypothetical protein HYY32_05530 [Chloroflexi bacterium]|nr:hypothetical protein [Chloroflexota bacterium]